MHGRYWLTALPFMTLFVGCYAHTAPTLEDLRPRCVAATRTLELQIERILPLTSTTSGRFDPSGLAIRNGQLYLVSDKDPSSIFAVTLQNDRAEARPAIGFNANANPAQGLPSEDLEGISIDSAGNFLLASESNATVWRVAFDGSVLASTSVHDQAVAQGLLVQDNAGLEGITALPSGDILLAAERDPRGLIQLPSNLDATNARIWRMPNSNCAAQGVRPNDFGDLTSVDDQVFALARNTHQVVRLAPGRGGWQEQEFWSYAQVENDPRYAYRDRTYGLAEGLALDREHVFIVLDNNDDARANDAQDHRPLLLIFRRP